MSQVDPWEKAAECARAIEISIDPLRKAVLSDLQDMWVALANQRNFLTQEELARQVKAIGRLHVKFGRADSVPASRTITPAKARYLPGYRRREHSVGQRLTVGLKSLAKLPIIPANHQVPVRYYGANATAHESLASVT